MALSPRLSAAVLDTGGAGAFCWPSGRIYVTRGLVDLLDDDELAAAVAHEVGHLVVDGHLARGAALDGCRRSCDGAGEDAESAADLMGREMLRVSAVPEEALPSLLNKLALHADTDSTCRAHFARRIARLASPANPS